MKIQNVIRVVAVFALLAFISCASAGKQFDSTHTIQNGVQDKNQIREWFGDPYQVQSISSSLSGCDERWTYIRSFWSWLGMKTKTATMIVYFSVNGKVCDHEYLEQ